MMPKAKIVKRINRFWAIYDVGGDLFVAPAQFIFCPFCGEGTFFTHRFIAYYHRSTGHWHIDVNAKCLVCDKFEVWGLPIPEPEETYERLKNSKYHGKTLRHELPHLMKALGYGEEDVEEIKARLTSWGYW